MFNFSKKSSHKKTLLAAIGAAAVLTAMPAAGTADTSASLLSPVTCEAAGAPVKEWTFQNDAGSWAFIGGWNYSGDASTVWDASNGGCLKVNVDFSDDKDQTWSEVKLSDGSITKENPLKVGSGVSEVDFDFYYDASQLKGDAALKAKLYASSAKDDDAVIDQPVDDLMSKAQSVPGTNLKKSHVRVILDDPVTDNIEHLEFSIVGYLTNYKGAVYIDNLEMK